MNKQLTIILAALTVLFNVPSLYSDNVDTDIARGGARAGGGVGRGAVGVGRVGGVGGLGYNQRTPSMARAYTAGRVVGNTAGAYGAYGSQNYYPTDPYYSGYSTSVQQFQQSTTYPKPVYPQPVIPQQR